LRDTCCFPLAQALVGIKTELAMPLSLVLSNAWTVDAADGERELGICESDRRG
jgi:hypothetical protein